MWKSLCLAVLMGGAEVSAWSTSRCGSCWGDANANPTSCQRPCSWDGDCAAVNGKPQKCFGGLWTSVCNINFNDAAHTCDPLPSDLTAQSSATDPDLTYAKFESYMGQATVNYQEQYGHFVEAMQDWGLDTNNMRKAQFLAQVKHETGDVCTLWQPVDNGAGDFHMLPNNFRVACREMPKLKAAFEKAFCGGVGKCSGDPCSKGSDFCAGKIVALPRFAHSTAAWWLASGSRLANSNCGDVRDQMDCGEGVAQPGFPVAVSTGAYRITQCIYGFGGSQPGTNYRIQYLNSAISLLGATADTSKCGAGGAAPSGGSSGGSGGSSDGQSDGNGGCNAGNRCGLTWGAAKDSCGTPCPQGTDAECGSSGGCYANLPAVIGSGSSGGSSDGSSGGSTGGSSTSCSAGARCGAGWSDANNRCGTPCPSGTNAECSGGETCFGSLKAIGMSAAEQESAEAAGSKMSTAAVVGVTLGVTLVVQLIVGAAVYAVVSKKKKSADNTYVSMTEDNGDQELA